MYKLFGKRTMQEILRDKATKMCFCVFLKLNFHQLPITSYTLMLCHSKGLTEEHILQYNIK